MSVYKLERKQTIKSDIDTIWQFFSRPNNLTAITPDYMNFRIISQTGNGDIYPGQIITYKVSPLLGIPLFWMTEITHAERNRLFIDEQRIGPYKLWHHQHIFEEADGQILMTDIVHYSLPYYILGKMAHGLFVKRQLENIFEYRRQKIDSIFNS